MWPLTINAREISLSLAAMRLIKRFKFEISILVIWAIAIASKYMFNGLVFGFDYGTYQPDGKFYTYMALDIIHRNPAESAQQVVDWYATHGFKMNVFTVQDLMPETSFAYSTISHRVLYPLLSVPFVMLFGIPGMLVVPSLSLLILFFSIQYLAKKFNKPFVGLLIVFILSISTTVTRWMVVNCTDALLVGLFSAVPIIILNYSQRKPFLFISLSSIILLTSATRFVLPFWITILVVVAFRYRSYLQCSLLLVFSVICAIPALNAQLATALLPADQNSSTLAKLIKLPFAFVRVVSIDILQLAVVDRIFLVVLVFSCIQAFRLRKRLSAQMFVAVVLAGYTIGAINGTLGVNFRYQIPVLVFMAWLILDSFRFESGSLRLVSPAKGNVIVDKAEK